MSEAGPITAPTFLAGVRCRRLGHLLHREPPAAETRSQRVRRRDRLELLKRARALFPGGMQVTGDHQERATRTRALLATGTTTAIFDATVQAGPLTAGLDILSQDGQAWNVTQVSQTFAGRRTSGQEHVNDLAYKALVLRKVGIPIGNISLLLLAPEFRLGDPDSYLFVRMNITKDVMDESGILEQIADQIVEAVQQEEPASATLKQACARCPFFLTRCLGRNAKNPITELPGLTLARTRSLFKAGITDTGQIPDDFPLNPLQSRVRTAIRSRREIVHDSLKSALERIPGPHTYLRINHMRPLLPVYEGWRCLKQFPTQFSVRYAEPRDGVRDQHFLADHHQDQQQELTERLLAALPNDGTIVTYTLDEKRLVRGMAKRCPHLIAQLYKIRRRLFSLGDLIRQHVYYPEFRGQFSFQKVYAYLLPKTPGEPLYIPDDGEADLLFAELAKNQTSAVDDSRNALIRQCSDHTLALAQLHQQLLTMGHKNPPGQARESHGTAGCAVESQG